MTLKRSLKFGNLFLSLESQKKKSLGGLPSNFAIYFWVRGAKKKRVKPKRMPGVFEVPFFRCLCLPSQLRTRTKLVDRAGDFFGRACWRSTFDSETLPRFWQSIFRPREPKKKGPWRPPLEFDNLLLGPRGQKKKESNPNECQTSSRCRFSAAFAFPRSSGPAQSWSTELAIWEGHAGGLRLTLKSSLEFGNLFLSLELSLIHI